MSSDTVSTTRRRTSPNSLRSPRLASVTLRELFPHGSGYQGSKSMRQPSRWLASVVLLD
ncbi:hypothetical protein BN903_37 [Halorubrum sp. AJ67]|nr:hypothetical protein BN903_37 [Halorubrum sp. AJ67]